MTEIQLTEVQSQAVQARQGKPVDLVDPATQRRYVLIERERYERVRELMEHGLPATDFTSPCASKEKSPERVRLRDLPTPPEVLDEAERCCNRFAWNRQEVVDQLKLQYYYGGQVIYRVRSAEGPVIVPVPERLRDTPDLRYVLLTPEERPSACLEVPSPWRDTISEILT